MIAGLHTSIGCSIRLEQPRSKCLACLVTQVLLHWDRAALGREGELPIERCVVETAVGSVLAGGGVVDSFQASPVDCRKTHGTWFATGVDLAAGERERF